VTIKLTESTDNYQIHTTFMYLFVVLSEFGLVYVLAIALYAICVLGLAFFVPYIGHLD